MKIVLISALGLAMAAVSVPADASGSGSGSRGGGWGNSANSANSGVSEAELLNRRGRSQVRKHITCKKCDYHNRLDSNTAAEIAQGVSSGRFNIKKKHRTAVLYYLRNRYGV